MSVYILRHFRLPTIHLQRGVLRLDGIVSANAPYTGGELVTTTGSRARLAGAFCVHASAGKRNEENATEQSKGLRRNAGREAEVIMRLAVDVARHRERSLPTPATGNGSATTRTPRPMCSRVTTTDGRSPGSRVAAFHRLPGGLTPVAFGERLAAYSCGGSRGIGLGPHRIPF